jgi:hypothetical protein
VDGDQLLLLTHRAEKPERVRAEPDQPDGHQRREAENGARRHLQALAREPRREREEGQQHARRHLDADAYRERCRSGAQARAGAGAEQQSAREREDDQRVVVRTADREHEQHGVQAHERRRPAA